MPQRPVAPSQERSRRTLERIVVAAREIFAERGESGFTIPEVSRRAQVSAGTIYRRFGSRQELLETVFARYARQESDELLAAWVATDWSQLGRREVIDTLVADLSRPWRKDPRLARAFMARRLAIDDEEAFGHGLAMMRIHAEAFRAAMLTHRREITHPDPDQAIDFAYRLIVGACGRWTARTIEVLAPVPMSWEKMFQNLGDVLETYIFG